MIPVALSIAGSDPSGGAGLQADLKVFHQFGVYGQAIPTLITVQNTLGVRHCELLSPQLILAQLEALLEDFPPHAMKTGALGSVEIVRTVAHAARNFAFPLIVDPVMLSTSGVPLGTADVRELLPYAALVTPNLAEAAALTEFPVDDEPGMRRAAESLHGMGARSVLVKGGHLSNGEALDILLHDGEFLRFSQPRILTPHTHGTGCAYAAAITALIACRMSMPEAVERAKVFISAAIRTNPELGRGSGPLNYWA